MNQRKMYHQLRLAQVLLIVLLTTAIFAVSDTLFFHYQNSNSASWMLSNVSEIGFNYKENYVWSNPEFFVYISKCYFMLLAAFVIFSTLTQKATVAFVNCNAVLMQLE